MCEGKDARWFIIEQNSHIVTLECRVCGDVKNLDNPINKSDV
jgi:hypothetical protein